MQITSTQSSSEVILMQELHKLADAGASVIQIRTREPVRASTILRKNLLGGGSPYKEWDAINGFRVFTTENFVDHKVAGDGKDFFTAFSTPLEELRRETSEVNSKPNLIHFFAFIDPHPYIANNPVVIELIQQYAAILPSTNVCILMVTPDVAIKDIPVGTVLVAELPTPCAEELQQVLVRIIEDATDQEDDQRRKTFPEGSELDEDDIRRVSYLGLGLTLYEFETYAAISVIDANLQGDTCLTVERMMQGIAEGKTAVVKQSEILELAMPEDINNVGGMHRLKDWIGTRANCYSDEAKEFGVEPPKGCALVGVPGAGKSLIAKAIASVLGVPLVRLDFGRVFSKYVGDSEERVRAALRMVESMAPVVLFVDEIDKGLGGAGGSGDSGTSSRVLGSFLTWLQEYKAPVFTMVTANRVDGLPPELLRRGRFDAIFSVGMPNDEERREVLDIHLRKRDRDISDFTEAEIDEFLRESQNYLPAEIESAVKDGLISAFSESADLEMSHIIDAMKLMIPMSVSHKENIDRIVAWAKDNATPVNYPREETVKAATSSIGGRRLIKPRTPRG